MNKVLINLLLSLFCIAELLSLQNSACMPFNWSSKRTVYKFYDDPIDVVIPVDKKDTETLNFCIESIQKNVKNVRRIIVISAECLTNNAEWFNENHFPFSKYDLGLQIYEEDRVKADHFISNCERAGWIYQQLLKLYAPIVIPNISSNVLVVDSDVIFYHPVEFLSESGAGLYNPGFEYFPPYFDHMRKLLPHLKKEFPEYSGISHHMLFQRSVIDDLFNSIEKYHQIFPWQAICRCINQSEINGSCMSEYEIYFNFVFSRCDQVKIRPLKWENGADISLEARENHYNSGFDYVAYHSYNRNLLENSTNVDLMEPTDEELETY